MALLLPSPYWREEALIQQKLAQKLSCCLCQSTGGGRCTSAIVIASSRSHYWILLQPAGQCMSG